MANTKVTGDLIASSTIATGNIADNAVTSDKISGITTAHITEGSNLYYTDARADARAALIVDSAPATLDTLNELAAALGDDPNFATTTANSIGTKLPLAGGTLTGALTGTTASFNAGATNVVATFTSTDGIAGIALVDNSGNVELSASGNTFQVQPAGGAAALSVTSTSATFAEEVSLKSRLNLQRSSAGATTLIQFKNENGVDRAHIDFGGTNEELSFFAGAGGTANMTIDASGNATFAGSLNASGQGYFGPVGTGNATTKAEMISNAVLRLKPHDNNSTNMNFAQVDNGSSMGIQVTNGPGTANWDIALSPFGGNVGIGTTAPSVKLDVVGEISSTDDINAGGKFVAANVGSDKKIAFRRTGANNF